MTRALRALAALAIAASFAATTAAHAVPDGLGFLCGFASNDDPTHVLANPDTQVGVQNGGPLLVVDFAEATGLTPSANNPVTASMTCWIQLNGTGLANDSASVASGTVQSGPSLPGVAICCSSGAEIQFADVTNTYQCSRIDVTDSAGNHTTLYADTDPDPNGNGTTLTTDPAAARCGLATSQSEDPCEILPLPSPPCPLPLAVKP